MCGNGLPVRMFLAQLRLVEAGRLTEADKLEEQLKNIGKEKLGTMSADAIVQHALADAAAAAAAAADLLPTGTEVHVDRNHVQTRAQLVSDFQKRHLFKRRQKCPLCRKRVPTVRDCFGRYFQLDFGDKLQKTRNKGRRVEEMNTADMSLLDCAPRRGCRNLFSSKICWNRNDFQLASKKCKSLSGVRGTYVVNPEDDEANEGYFK